MPRYISVAAMALIAATLFSLNSGAASQTAPGAMPEQADISYRGDYEVSVSNPAPPRRTPSLRDLVGGSKKFRGALTFNLERRGQALSGLMVITGGSPTHNKVTGTYQNGHCTLYTNETIHEGLCDSRGFAGTITSTGTVAQKVQGKFQTAQIKLVDAAEQQRERAAAAAAAQERARLADAEAARVKATEEARLAALPKANATQARLLANAIEQDSKSWSFNEYEAGSLSNVRTITSAGSITLRGDYKYRGGSTGWVEGRVRAGKVECLTYHNTRDCAALRLASKAASQTGASAKSDDIWPAFEQKTKCLAKAVRNREGHSYTYNRVDNVATGRSYAPTAYEARWEVRIKNTCAHEVRFQMSCQAPTLMGLQFRGGQHVLKPGDSLRNSHGECIYIEEIK